jgi:hypothetical protein
LRPSPSTLTSVLAPHRVWQLPFESQRLQAAVLRLSDTPNGYQVVHRDDEISDRWYRPASSGFGQPVIGEPAAELLRCSDVILENGGVDLGATNPIGVARQAKPHVLDPQHCRTLAVSDRVTQCLMPSRDVLVRIAQPQREVEPEINFKTSRGL